MHHPGAEKFLQTEVQAHFDQVIRELTQAGAQVRSIKVPDLELAREALIAIIEPEASLIHRDLLQQRSGRLFRYHACATQSRFRDLRRRLPECAPASVSASLLISSVHSKASTPLFRHPSRGWRPQKIRRWAARKAPAR